VGVVDIRTTLLRKIQTNRLELFDGDTDNWILYDDDAITPLITFSISDKDGDVIVQCSSSPSKRSGATGVSGVLSPDIYMRKSVYDSDDDGCVSCAENVSDGIHTSTASGIKYAVDNAHTTGMDRQGRATISGTADQVTINFTDLGHTDYIINATLENDTDSPPSIYSFIVSERTSSSFVVDFSDNTDSSNYYLNWTIVED
jgi:hypothetical protein